MPPPTLGQLFTKEFQSFKSPPPKEVAPLPKVGEPAPTHDKLKPAPDKPTIIVFLRHCGCPFAEKAFRNLTAFSNKHHPQIHCIAVSHSDQQATDDWVEHVGGAWETEVVVDEERDVYAAWGLGLSSYWHAIGPFSIYNAVQLGKNEGIWNRTTESGTRWQVGGAFAVDKKGVVKWVSVARTASEVPDMDAALRALIEVPTEAT
ncbi:hypothetical protein VP1G_06094 [Cytospora mali]|uniref:Thioredoxin domain-containing protein n=1 Tax=Cytospora mali TaxID=578113 RepID=A0A194V4P3_CYTMA|nr:hypothetical protein VP1G_06094 [Valsa mali var. pyri (nom. inval.)]